MKEKRLQAGTLPSSVQECLIDLLQLFQLHYKAFGCFVFVRFVTFVPLRSFRSLRFPVDLFPLDDASHTHSGTNAHGGQAELLALALQLGENGGDLASTGASQG